MSEVMLHGVLNMPIDIWSNTLIDQRLRYLSYIEASQIITDQAAEIKQLKEDLALYSDGYA